MTKIKLCGLSRACDLEAANELRPEYIGFVFAPKSRRYVSPEKAAEMKGMLASGIQAVGVFVNEAPQKVAALLTKRVIDIAQLHGTETEEYIKELRTLTDQPIIKAFRVETVQDAVKVNQSQADYVLLDSGAGTGMVFDWSLIKMIQRPYFLAGGLDAENVSEAIKTWHPYAVDVSSGVEHDGYKDKNRMAAFVCAVRKEETL